MSELEKFMQNEIPGKRIKKSILKNKKNEIDTLHETGYTLQQIVEYLKVTYKITTSRQTISKILKDEWGVEND